VFPEQVAASTSVLGARGCGKTRVELNWVGGDESMFVDLVAELGWEVEEGDCLVLFGVGRHYVLLCLVVDQVFRRRSQCCSQSVKASKAGLEVVASKIRVATLRILTSGASRGDGV